MISAVVITKNEEKILSSCLSKLTFCSEIIVVDDYSTDKTVQIAKKYTRKVYKRKLNNDFSKQRNFALSKAKNKWVLFVDSDERIDKKLADEIKKAVKNDSFDGYFIKRTDYFLGKEMKWGEFLNKKFVRLGKKKEGVWKRAVHEYWDIKGKKAVFDTPIKHYPHASLSELVKKSDEYSTINAQYLYDTNEAVTLFEVFLYPSIKFVHNYILKLGFLDGFYGLVFNIFMSFQSFLSRLKLYMLVNYHDR